MKRVTEEQEKQMVELYKTGTTQRELVEQFGFALSTVQGVLRRNNALASRSGRRPRLDGRQLKAMYERGMTLQQIADEFGVHNSSVWSYLKRAGAKLRPAGFQPGEAHHGWTGGLILSSCGYRMVRIYPDDPMYCMAVKKVEGASYVLEHRLVMAQAMNRPLSSTETVHHVDGNKLNNKLENLQLRQGRHGKGTAYRCVDCGSHNVEEIELQ